MSSLPVLKKFMILGLNLGLLNHLNVAVLGKKEPKQEKSEHFQEDDLDDETPQTTGPKCKEGDTKCSQSQSNKKMPRVQPRIPSSDTDPFIFKPMRLSADDRWVRSGGNPDGLQLMYNNTYRLTIRKIENTVEEGVTENWYTLQHTIYSRSNDVPPQKQPIQLRESMPMRIGRYKDNLGYTSEQILVSNLVKEYYDGEEMMGNNDWKFPLMGETSGYGSYPEVEKLYESIYKTVTNMNLLPSCTKRAKVWDYYYDEEFGNWFSVEGRDEKSERSPYDRRPGGMR